MNEGNPNHDAQGRFASASGEAAPKTPHSKPPTWHGGEYKAGSADPKDHADRAAYHRDRAQVHASRAQSAKDPAEAKAHAILAAKSAEHAQTCSERAVKAAAKNPSEESARQAGRAMASAKAARASSDEAGLATQHTPAAVKAAKEPKFLKQDENAITIHGEKELLAVSGHVTALSHNELADASNRIYKKADYDEKKAMFEGAGCYTGSGYLRINGNKSEKGLRNPPPDSDAQKKINTIDGLFKKDAAERDMVVHRGANGVDPESFKVGGTFHDPGYMSTSIKENTAKDFSGKVVMHIHVPKGHPVIHIGDHSANEGEGEILLPRGSRIKILGLDTQKSQYGGTTTLHVHARII